MALPAHQHIPLIALSRIADLAEQLVLWDNLTPEEAIIKATEIITGHDTRPVIAFQPDAYDEQHPLARAG